MKFNPVIISIASVLITVASLYVKDRVLSIVDTSKFVQQLEQAQREVSSLHNKVEEQNRILATKDDIKRLEEVNKQFVTREEAGIQFRAISERLEIIQSDLRELMRNVNKR